MSVSPLPGPVSLRLGTRGSLLARTQSGLIRQALMDAHRDLQVELVTISTSGDRLSDRPLAEAGGKGLFTKELEQALLAGQIDLAVHSLKDVPVTMPLVEQTDLIVAAIPCREDPRDVLVSRAARSLGELASGMKVGTGSLRRRCQILQARPDLIVQPLRGNVDTRLARVESGQFDAIILAMAGLVRIGRFEPSYMFPIDTEVLLPAAGQGALALQCRRGDQQTIARVGVLNDPAAAEAVRAERGVVAALGGDCRSAIGALAVLQNECLILRAAAGAPDGNPPVARGSATVLRENWQEAVELVCRRLAGAEPQV